MPYPPFRIKKEDITEYNSKSYEASLSDTFGIDIDIDLENLIDDDKKCLLYNFIIFGMGFSWTSYELLSEEDTDRFLKEVGGFSEDRIVKIATVNAFIKMYLEGMNKHHREYKKFFEFFNGNNI